MPVAPSNALPTICRAARPVLLEGESPAEWNAFQAALLREFTPVPAMA